MVLTERRDAVAMVILNRPQRLNAMTKEMGCECTAELARLAQDESVRCVVLTGAGRGFCAGGDLGDISEISSDAEIDIEAETTDLLSMHRSSLLLHEMRKPTIAAVNGPAAGVGMSWACAADLRIAGKSCLFRTSFAGAGLSGDFGGTWTLSRIVGPAKARELYLLNEKVRAAEALSLGLVTRVVPDGRLRDEAWDLAQRLATGPPLALARIKQNLNDSEVVDFASALDLEARRQAESAATADCAEAAAAFLDKREPRFTGR